MTGCLRHGERPRARLLNSARTPGSSAGLQPHERLSYQSGRYRRTCRAAVLFPEDIAVRTECIFHLEDRLHRFLELSMCLLRTWNTSVLVFLDGQPFSVITGRAMIWSPTSSGHLPALSCGCAAGRSAAGFSPASSAACAATLKRFLQRTCIRSSAGWEKIARS